MNFCQQPHQDHQEEASYICLYSECTERKMQNYFLCHQCQFLENNNNSKHFEHRNYCINIKDLRKDLEAQISTINQKKMQAIQQITQVQNMIQQLEKKKSFVQELFDKLSNFENSEQVFKPSEIIKLEKYALRPVSIRNNVETYQIQHGNLAENKISCQCNPENFIQLFVIGKEKDISLGKRTVCIDCQNKVESQKISLEKASVLIQQAEQEEMYINEMKRVQQEQLKTQTKINQIFTKLEILKNYKSMYFSDALTTKCRSVKNILAENPSRSQYQKLAEFLSSYQQVSQDQIFDFIPLTTVCHKFKTILSLLDQLDQTFSEIDIFQRGFVYTVICEIYKRNEHQQTKILVVKKDIKVNDFISLIKKVCPNLREVVKFKLNDIEENRITNQQLLLNICNYGDYGKLRLIY